MPIIKIMRKTTFLALALAFSTFAIAQRGCRDSNRIGISAGINQFTLNTSDFETKAGTGWNAGLSVRGNYYNNFSMVYGIQFSENKFTITPESPLDREIECKIPSAQISLMLSYRIFENHLSIEFGPMLQVNGKIGMEDQDKTTILNSEGLLAGELEDISTFNFYPTLSVTGGFTQLRAQVYYQYGVNNILGKTDPASGKVKGNAGILGANIIFYL